MIINEEEYLSHYGTPRHSGRYPWGSHNNEGFPQRNPKFLDMYRNLKKQGLTDKEIYKGLGITSTEFRAKRSIALHEERQENIARAQALKDKGVSGTKAAALMGVPEATYRSFLEPGAKDRADKLINTANMLQKHADKNWKTKSPTDVGSGVEGYIGKFGISPENMRASLAILKEKGYNVHTVDVDALGTKFKTKNKVLVPPGVDQHEAWLNRFNIKQIKQFSSTGGKVWGATEFPPMSLDSKRVGVRYAEDGGGEADGVLFVREGVKDVSLGKSRYAQVRVLVDNTHYLKGMAVYKENLPEGVDVVFNTNKSSTGNKLDVMKEIKPDKDFPFGSVIDDQVIDNKGTPEAKLTSVMNLVNQQGDWAKWARTLSSQMLSKQSPRLAQEQLNVTYERRKQEFDEINALTNPTVKKELLTKFSEETDSAAAHLKAASFPRSNWHAILPIDSIKTNEIFAPNYKNGEKVVLVRYPHGGRFEIPELVVNNRNPEARKLIGDTSKDAVGIHHEVAKVLSGADFDGDTVLVIPNEPRKFLTHPPLEELKNFDPLSYKIPDDQLTEAVKTKLKNVKQTEMGKISNLITDMSIKGAPHDQLARAIKHSMVVIDCEKGLDYKLSAKRNGIAALKEEYQGGANKGAATLVSRKKSEDRKALDRRPARQNEGGPINPVTGRLQFVPSGKMRRNAKGELVPKLTTINKLQETPDAHTLSSGTRMEDIYANHSNKLKDLANQARLEVLRTPLLKQSDSAKRTYQAEIESLNAKLSIVKKNRPRERKAQNVANAKYKMYLANNPNLDSDQKKTLKFKELQRARDRFGAQHEEIDITQQEWNAIQAGAISDNHLSQILKKANIATVRKLATPRVERKMTSTKTQRARSMLNDGYTLAEVAQALGVSVSTLNASLE